MERISIFNYEAFYLDFLEGNLNEEDTALLMAFFEENPELKIDDMELPVFHEEHHALNADFKNDLKQPAITDPINLDNVEFFMIANAEDLLSVDKTMELDAFLTTHAELEKESRIYNAVYFTPDSAIIFENKEGLKRRTIVLWPYAASIAAIAIIAFLLIWGSINNSGKNGTNNVLAEKNEQRIESTVDQSGDPTEQYIPVIENESSIEDYIQENPNVTPSISNDVPIQEKKQRTDIINGMERIPAGNVLTAMSNVHLEPITGPSFKPVNHEINGSEALASASMVNNMENPIEPITNFIADKTNTDIDFQRTKRNADPKEGKGFFIKIGKFEFSRKKH